MKSDFLNFTCKFWKNQEQKVFLEILQNSQENTTTRLSFLIKLKLQASGLQLY